MIFGFRLPKPKKIKIRLALGRERIVLTLDLLKTAEAMGKGLETLSSAAELGDGELLGTAFASMVSDIFGKESAEKIFRYYQSRTDRLAIYFVPFVLKKLYGKINRKLLKFERRQARLYR